MALLEQGPLLVIVIVILLLFGATQIPRLARALGRAQGEFKKARDEFGTEVAKGAAEVEDEAAIRRRARELGIDETGRSLEEIKRLIHGKA
jgi:sec-independent protein translocase protein TatA